MLNQREITNDYGRDKTKRTQQAQGLGFDHPKLESFRRLAFLFFFYLAKKTWTIIEGIEYAFFDVYLFVFDCKIDANTFLPIFFHF